ncbi:hypothetical protein [Chitinophaga sp. YIM B06452]|uniref:hypothetical protein n=1 Tax=Chitinophaga sp. YIM B06452 TaxID=3082158 RepID=UPI0031FE801C
MTELEFRNKFSEIVFTYIQVFGFTIKQTSRGKGSSGFIIFEKMLENGTKYALQLTFTSHFDVGPFFNITYPEIDNAIRSLDKTFAKNQGTSTLNCYFFEVLNPANADGYLHHSAGYPYYNIKEPHSSENIIKHGSSFATELIVPVLEKILPITDSLQKADYILNEKNPLIKQNERN